jgi:uncharacterized protein YutE (UPF0331/DUF86 family)
LIEKEVIESRLHRLSNYLKILNDLRTIQVKEFISDPKIYGSAERFLHLSIECTLDIGNYIISLKQFRCPKDYREIFTILGKQKILPKELVNELEKMAQFRNRLVHVYWDLDHKFVHKILQTSLNDFNEFAKYIVDFIEKENTY